MTKRRELWFTAPRAVELRPGAELPLEAGHIRARAIASGVSQGTELLLYRGEGPTPFDSSLDPPGTPTYPRRYGYAWVGEVVETRSDVVPVGSRVFALKPHGDEHVIAEDAARVIPRSIPGSRATLAANLETAITVVWDAELSLGDEIAIVGGGIVGLLSAWLARKVGVARVRVIEPSARRRETALALGADEARSPEDDDPRGNCDAVIEASGDPTCLNRAIAHAARDATIVVASFYGERTSPVALGSDFHRRRLTLKSSQVSRVPLAKMSRWNAARRFALVLDLLQDEHLDALIDPAVTIDQATEVYARLASDPGGALQTVFSYADTPALL